MFESNDFIGQEFRRILFSLKTRTGRFYHIFSIFEKLEPDMQDVDSFVPNFGDEYNDMCSRISSKKDKLFFTVDRVMMTEDMFRHPWKNYYSGSELICSLTEDYVWPDGESQWRIISSMSDNESELVSMLPRRTCPKYVRHCIPERIPEVLDYLFNDDGIRSQLSELSMRNLGFDLTLNSFYRGAFIFLTYGSKYKRMTFMESDDRMGVYVRVNYWPSMLEHERLFLQCKRKSVQGGILGISRHELDGKSNLYHLDFKGSFNSLTVDVMDSSGNLVDYFTDMTFIHNLKMHMRVVDTQVRVINDEGRVEEVIDKFTEEKTFLIGKRLSPGLMDSSPEYAYKKFEDALDFVFFDGDRNSREANVARSTECIEKIIDSAHERLYVCDVFFDAKSLERFILRAGNRNLPIRILSGLNELKKHGRGVGFKKKLNEYNKKGIARLECRVLLGSKAELHDRFIIADDDVWMLGCSLNEFGVRATSLIRVPRQYRGKLIERAEQWWSDDTVSSDISQVDFDSAKPQSIICRLFGLLTGKRKNVC